MSILLAPMEGLLDFALRDVLTRAGGIDRCVSEFIRVTDALLPERVFYRVVPELANGGLTPAGVPVRVQLLGSDHACLAENAARVAQLSATGVDLNFGCPAKVVNRHGGGAALLKEPEHLHRIMVAVRKAVPMALPVSAKMRLGFFDDALAVDCALALQAGGASELVVHARTKAHGYRPPAYWERIADIRAAVRIPLVANGEIWTVADARRCRAASGCNDLMLGRGMVANPGLALAILAGDGHSVPCNLINAGGQPHLTWLQLHALIDVFWNMVQVRIEPKARAGRLKQWLNFLRRSYPEAEVAYQQVRAVADSREVAHLLGLTNVAQAPRKSPLPMSTPP